MAEAGRSKAIIDTSVLINFLKIDRVDLLASHPLYRFVAIDLVRDEVSTHYADQVVRLVAAIDAGQPSPVANRGPCEARRSVTRPVRSQSRSHSTGAPAPSTTSAEAHQRKDGSAQRHSQPAQPGNGSSATRKTAGAPMNSNSPSLPLTLWTPFRRSSG